MTTTTRARRAPASINDTAGVYTRISDDRESEELGVTRQDEDGCGLAAARGLKVHRTYPDNDTGASTKSTKPRPGYDALLADARAGRIGTIIAYSSSRLTRRPLELEQQIKLAETYGTRFLYVRSPSFDLNTADGRQVARMLAAADAAEAERTGERVQRAALQRAENGQNHGGQRAYGFGMPTGRTDADDRPVIDYTAVVPAERDVIREVADQLLKGVSLRSVVADLNRRGVPTATGKGKGKWSGGTLRDALLRPRIAGATVNNGDQVGRLPGEPILDEGTWLALVGRMTAKTVTWVDASGVQRTAGRFNNTGRPPKWLGTGIYLCPCGSTLDVGPRESYRCRSLRTGPGGGGHVRRSAPALDAYVSDVVVARLSRPDAVDLFARPAAPGVDLAALRVKAVRLRDIKGAYAVMLGRDERPDDMDDAEFSIARRANKDALAEVESRLATAVQTSPAADVAGAEDVRAAWERLSLGQRRAIVVELCTVTVLPTGPRGRGFDRDAVRIEPRQ